MMRATILCAVLLAALADGYLVNVQPCEKFPNEHCTVSEVRVEPCASQKFCKLKKGSDASISFDYTPDFVAEKLKTEAVWTGPMGDLDFVGLNKDGCASAPCPSVAGTKQTFSYSLPIGKKLPPGTYPLNWKLYDEADPTKMCCFKMTVKLGSS